MFSSEKNIAIFVNTIKSGGAEKQSIFLLNSLKDYYPTFFIIWYGEQIDYKILNLNEGNNYSLIRLEGNIFKKIYSLYKILKENRITHLFSFLTKPNFLGALVGRIARVEKIYTGIRTSKFPSWKFIIERFTANFLSTSTIFNNRAGEGFLRNNGFKKTIIIENCYPSINEAFARPQKSDFIIITVGRFVEVKDYKTAILSISELKKIIPDFTFQIVGYGKLEPQIRKWILEENLEDCINLFINPDNIPELLNNADIYISTSLNEGTSNSLMEAMNASLPIVATNVGDNNRLVLEGENGFLHDIGDYKSISKSMETLISNYKMRIDFGIRSNQILREKYSFEKFKKIYLSLIQ